LLSFASGLPCQFRRQAAQLAYAGGVDEDAAGGENRDAFYPPLFLLRRGESGPDFRRLEWVGWTPGQLVAFPDGRSFPSVNDAIARLTEADVLKQITIGKRNRAFEAKEVIDAFTSLADPPLPARVCSPV
jgi:hypothetical protein